jgi:hypothetical protein
MAAPLDRTWYNALADDTGTGTNGTVWNKAQINGLLNTIDASHAPLVDKSGTPVAGQIAVFQDADTVAGDTRAFVTNPVQGTLNFTPASAMIANNTADGADTASLAICGGGGSGGVTRGANVTVYGNESAAAQPGNCIVHLGRGTGNPSFTVSRGTDFASILAVYQSGDITIPFGKIQFPATQNPSTDVNTLDDYREGSWTPTLSGASGGSGQTYATQTGAFQKVGRWVSANFYIVLTAAGTLTGDLQIRGLPYAGDAQNVLHVATIGWHQLATNYTSIVGSLDPFATWIRLTGATTASTTNAIGVPPSAVRNDSIFFGSVRYQTAN